MVLCMAIEQYRVVLEYHDREQGRKHSYPASTSTPSSSEHDDTLADFFTRTYSSPSHLGASLPIRPPLTSSELQYVAHTTPPDWLLNLIFLTRFFLQRITTMEWSDKKRRILALRPFAETLHKEIHNRQPASSASTTASSLSDSSFELPSPPIHSDLSYRIVHNLITILIDLPVTNETLELHMELSSLLLVLFSTQVYVPLSCLYADDNLFLTHALLGPISQRAPMFLSKMITNTTRCIDRLSRRAGPSSPSHPSHSSPLSLLPSNSQLLSVSAMTSSAVDPRSGNVSPLAPHQQTSQAMIGNGTSLSARLHQLAARTGFTLTAHTEQSPSSASSSSHPTLLKRLGSRLFSLLLIPVQLYRFLFSLGRPTPTFEHEPLGIRSTLLLLLLTHQSTGTFRSNVPIEDIHGRERMIVYPHAKEVEFDWRRWRDETHDAHSQSSTSVSSTPFVPTSSSSSSIPPSSIRSTAPPVQLSVRISPPPSSFSSHPLPPGMNPYKAAIKLLADDAWEFADDDSSQAGYVSSASSWSSVSISPSPAGHPHPTISFETLYEFLTISTTSEASTLLLYSLLQANAAFREFILVKSDIDLLVLPYLSLLYSHSSSDSSKASSSQSHLGPDPFIHSPLRHNRIYMVLILLLILSKDRGFVDNIHRRLILKRVPFYAEANLSNISLGSTMILVLLKTLQSNLYSPRDNYVHTNCLAILSNIAPVPDPIDSTLSSTSGIKLHPAACLKLVALLSTLSRKYAKLMEREKNGRSNNGQRSIESNEVEVSSFASFIRLVLDLLLAFLSGVNLSHNSYLIYSLLQRVEVLTPFASHSSSPFFEQANELQARCQYFRERMELHAAGITHNAERRSENGTMNGAISNLSALSIEALLAILKSEIKLYRPSSSITSVRSRTQFSYEEQPASEEFFIPYIWFVARQQPNLLAFADSLIVLFGTGQDEDDHTDAHGEIDSFTSPSAEVRLAAEMEQLHAEHVLQQQIGVDTSSLSTPQTETRLISTLDQSSGTPYRDTLANNSAIARGDIDH